METTAAQLREILAWASLLVAVFVRQCMREVEFAAARQQDAAK
jgi:hypothetical protein